MYKRAVPFPTKVSEWAFEWLHTASGRDSALFAHGIAHLVIPLSRFVSTPLWRLSGLGPVRNKYFPSIISTLNKIMKRLARDVEN